MKAGKIILAAIYLDILAVTAVGAATRVFRPPCHTGSGAYLLAQNSGAIIRVDRRKDGEGGSAIIVYRPRLERGWASRRLVSRFDLETTLDKEDVTIRNANVTCRIPR
jgi:hypothetical protein